MADNKKYYYLKLKDNFFESDAIQILESLQDGYLYSNILLKLYLKSLKDDGRLMFNNRIPYNPTVLATITRHTVGVVEKALKIFEDLGLIEILDNGAIYMLDIQNFIGESSTEADRIRMYRKTIAEEKNTLVQMYDKCTPEIEIEKEIEKEIDIERESEREKAEVKTSCRSSSKKESKHKYGEYKHVLLKDSEIEKLNQEFGQLETQKAITYLDEYIEMKGVKYKSHYLALRKWVFDAVKQKQSKNTGYNNKQSTTEFYDDMRKWVEERQSGAQEFEF